MSMRLIAFLGVCTILIAGCRTDALINETREIEGGAWGFSNTQSFDVVVENAETDYNYYVHVRHGGDYRYRNLIVYFKTFYPNNTYKVDTVDCPLAEPNGKWLGSGLGDLLDNRILFKINDRLPQAGAYNFEIQHAMRADTIHEIYDVGLLIEPVSK